VEPLRLSTPSHQHLAQLYNEGVERRARRAKWFHAGGFVLFAHSRKNLITIWVAQLYYEGLGSEVAKRLKGPNPHYNSGFLRKKEGGI